VSLEAATGVRPGRHRFLCAWKLPDSLWTPVRLLGAFAGSPPSCPMTGPVRRTEARPIGAGRPRLVAWCIRLRLSLTC